MSRTPEERRAQFEATANKDNTPNYDERFDESKPGRGRDDHKQRKGESLDQYKKRLKDMVTQAELDAANREVAKEIQRGASEAERNGGFHDWEWED